MANFIETLKLNASGNTVPSAPHSENDQIYPRTLFEAVYTNANINLVTYFNNLRILYKLTQVGDSSTVKYIDKDPLAISSNSSNPTNVTLFRLSGSIIELEPDQQLPTTPPSSPWAYRDDSGNIKILYGSLSDPETYSYEGETKIESIALS